TPGPGPSLPKKQDRLLSLPPLLTGPFYGHTQSEALISRKRCRCRASASVYSLSIIVSTFVSAATPFYGQSYCTGLFQAPQHFLYFFPLPQGQG
ncbi:MAG: hypothetical protein WBK58_03775, partial [Dethiobacteria bacterium]